MNRRLIGVEELGFGGQRLAVFFDVGADGRSAGAIELAGSENAARWSDGRANVGVPTVQTYDSCEIYERFVARRTP